MEAVQQFSFRYVYNLLLVHFNIPTECASLVYITILREMDIFHFTTKWMMARKILCCNDDTHNLRSFINNYTDTGDIVIVCQESPRFHIWAEKGKIFMHIQKQGSCYMLEWNKNSTPHTYFKHMTYWDRMPWSEPEVVGSITISEQQFYHDAENLMEIYTNL